MHRLLSLAECNGNKGMLQQEKGRTCKKKNLSWPTHKSLKKTYFLFSGKFSLSQKVFLFFCGKWIKGKGQGERHYCWHFLRPLVVCASNCRGCYLNWIGNWCIETIMFTHSWSANGCVKKLLWDYHHAFDSWRRAKSISIFCFSSYLHANNVANKWKKVNNKNSPCQREMQTIRFYDHKRAEKWWL